MNQFKKLIVWQKSMLLAKIVFTLTDKLPVKEKFGLISQINRCAVSIPSNIAEGSGRNSTKEYCYFLSISLGSAFELETQLLLCIELEYLKKEEITETMNLIHEIQKMLNSLQRKLNPILSTKY